MMAGDNIKTLEELNFEIARYHEHLRQYPTDTPAKKKLEDRLNKWYEQLDITVFVANNEQLPYTSKELGFRTKPMLSKAQTGCSQVGDYNFHIDNIGGKFLDGFGGLVVERKTCADFYGTMFGARDRFYREVQRFHDDSRFDTFYIFVESDLITWLNYRPPNSPIDPMINQKMAVLGSLEARGAHVVWCGNRAIATRLYSDYVKQYCIKNYARILRLDDGGRAFRVFDND